MIQEVGRLADAVEKPAEIEIVRRAYELWHARASTKDQEFTCRPSGSYATRINHLRCALLTTCREKSLVLESAWVRVGASALMEPVVHTELDGLNCFRDLEDVG